MDYTQNSSVLCHKMYHVELSHVDNSRNPTTRAELEEEQERELCPEAQHRSKQTHINLWASPLLQTQSAIVADQHSRIIIQSKSNQFIFIYISAGTIKIVTRCFTEARGLTPIKQRCQGKAALYRGKP